MCFVETNLTILSLIYRSDRSTHHRGPLDKRIAETVTTPIQMPTAYGTRSHSITAHIHTLILYSYCSMHAYTKTTKLENYQNNASERHILDSLHNPLPFPCFMCRLCNRPHIGSFALTAASSADICCASVTELRCPETLRRQRARAVEHGTISMPVYALRAPFSVSWLVTTALRL